MSFMKKCIIEFKLDNIEILIEIIQNWIFK